MRNKAALAWLVLALAGPVLAQEGGEAKPKFEVYGFAQADYIQDFNRVDSNWDSTLRASRIPTTKGQFGSDHQATVSVKQSRLGATGTIPTDRGPVFAKFEFDMFGVGANQGQTTIRLRHAYGTWNHILGGQTHSLFMDVDVFPNVLDYWGPSGMVFLRTPQLRYSPIDERSLWGGKNTVSVAIEHPVTDVDPGQARELDPALGNNITSDDKVPDLTAQFRHEREWGHVQLGAILRGLGYETLNTPGNDPSGHALGWGLDLTSNVKTWGKSKFDLGVVYGEGIATYMNDGGVDLAAKRQGAGFIGSPERLWGILAYYDHHWSEKWSSTFGYSRTQVQNTDGQLISAFHGGQYASANIVWYPVKDVFLGAEFLWGERVDNNAQKGIDRRMQFSAHYNFSTDGLFKQINPEA